MAAGTETASPLASPVVAAIIARSSGAGVTRSCCLLAQDSLEGSSEASSDSGLRNDSSICSRATSKTAGRGSAFDTKTRSTWRSAGAPGRTIERRGERLLSSVAMGMAATRLVLPPPPRIALYPLRITLT